MELDAALRMGFRLGDWEVKPIEGLVTGAEGSHHLQPKTMDVLVCLAASPGQVVTRDEIIERVWNGSAVSDEHLLVVYMKSAAAWAIIVTNPNI
jgi:DNA-binding winged helix-turn-helix (wHTH) protein